MDNVVQVSSSSAMPSRTDSGIWPHLHQHMEGEVSADGGGRFRKARYSGSLPTSEPAMNETTGDASTSASRSSSYKRSISSIRAKESGRPLAPLLSS